MNCKKSLPVLISLFFISLFTCKFEVPDNNNDTTPPPENEFPLQRQTGDFLRLAPANYIYWTLCNNLGMTGS